MSAGALQLAPFAALAAAAVFWTSGQITSFTTKERPTRAD